MENLWYFMEILQALLTFFFFVFKVASDYLAIDRPIKYVAKYLSKYSSLLENDGSKPLDTKQRLSVSSRVSFKCHDKNYNFFSTTQKPTLPISKKKGRVYPLDNENLAYSTNFAFTPIPYAVDKDHGDIQEWANYAEEEVDEFWNKDYYNLVEEVVPSVYNHDMPALEPYFQDDENKSFDASGQMPSEGTSNEELGNSDVGFELSNHFHSEKSDTLNIIEADGLRIKCNPSNIKSTRQRVHKFFDSHLQDHQNEEEHPQSTELPEVNNTDHYVNYKSFFFTGYKNSNGKRYIPYWKKLFGLSTDNDTTKQTDHRQYPFLLQSQSMNTVNSNLNQFSSLDTPETLLKSTQTSLLSSQNSSEFTADSSNSSSSCSSTDQSSHSNISRDDESSISSSSTDESFSKCTSSGSEKESVIEQSVSNKSGLVAETATDIYDFSTSSPVKTEVATSGPIQTGPFTSTPLKESVSTSSDDKESVSTSSDDKESVSTSSDDKESVSTSSDDKESVSTSSDDKESVSTSSDDKESVSTTTDDKESVSTTTGLKESSRLSGAVTSESVVRNITDGSAESSSSRRLSVEVAASSITTDLKRTNELSTNRECVVFDESVLISQVEAEPVCFTDALIPSFYGENNTLGATVPTTFEFKVKKNDETLSNGDEIKKSEKSENESKSDYSENSVEEPNDEESSIVDSNACEEELPTPSAFVSSMQNTRVRFDHLGNPIEARCRLSESDEDELEYSEDVGIYEKDNRLSLVPKVRWFGWLNYLFKFR